MCHDWWQATLQKCYEMRITNWSALFPFLHQGVKGEVGISGEQGIPGPPVKLET